MEEKIAYGVKAKSILGDVMAEFEYIGEGYDGDYNPLELGDRPLLRLYLSEKDEDGEWQEVDGSSVCTLVVATTPAGELEKILDLICKDFVSARRSGWSIRRCAAKYSFADVDNYEKLLAA